MAAVYEITPVWMNLTVVPGGIQLSWNSYWGQVYTVMSTDNLAHPFVPMIEDIDATPPLNTQFIANPPGGMFFKLRVDQR